MSVRREIDMSNSTFLEELLRILRTRELSYKVVEVVVVTESACAMTTSVSGRSEAFNHTCFVRTFSFISILNCSNLRTELTFAIY